MGGAENIDLLALLPGNAAHAVADYMNDTKLDLSLGNSLDRLGKALEAVHAGDEALNDLVEVSKLCRRAGSRISSYS